MYQCGQKIKGDFFIYSSAQNSLHASLTHSHTFSALFFCTYFLSNVRTRSHSNEHNSGFRRFCEGFKNYRSIPLSKIQVWLLRSKTCKRERLKQSSAAWREHRKYAKVSAAMFSGDINEQVMLAITTDVGHFNQRKEE